MATRSIRLRQGTILSVHDEDDICLEEALAILGDISAYNDWIERHLSSHSGADAARSMRSHIRELRRKVMARAALPAAADKDVRQ